MAASISFAVALRQLFDHDGGDVLTTTSQENDDFSSFVGPFRYAIARPFDTTEDGFECKFCDDKIVVLVERNLSF